MKARSMMLTVYAHQLEDDDQVTVIWGLSEGGKKPNSLRRERWTSASEASPELCSLLDSLLSSFQDIKVV